MKLHVQVVHRAIGFVDRLIDGTLLVEPQRVDPPPASEEEMQHRPDSVAERFGLLDREAMAFHADTVYTYIFGLSRLCRADWTMLLGPLRV